MVRGPSEGHKRTEGGRSNLAPGYLGNTDTETGLLLKDQLNNVHQVLVHQDDLKLFLYSKLSQLLKKKSGDKMRR